MRPTVPYSVIEATETAAGTAQFRVSPDGPAAVPNHPPIALIPPMRMPSQDRGHDAANKSQGPGKGVIFDVRTRKSFEIAARLSEAKDGLFMGGGYSGACDRGAGLEEALQPDSPSAPFTLLSWPPPGLWTLGG